jgi:hypothetical protein
LSAVVVVLSTRQRPEIVGAWTACRRWYLTTVTIRGIEVDVRVIRGGGPSGLSREEVVAHYVASSLKLLRSHSGP